MQALHRKGHFYLFNMKQNVNLVEILFVVFILA